MRLSERVAHYAFTALVLIACGCVMSSKRASSNLNDFHTFCSPRTGHVAATLPLEEPSRSNPETDKRKSEIIFKNYYEAFLDAKEQQKYVDCLAAERPANYRADRKQARKWLRQSQETIEESASSFSNNKRIRDVEERFEPAGDGKTTVRHLTITLQDGSQTVVEEKIPTDQN